jgi:hypothetical protein
MSAIGRLFQIRASSFHFRRGYLRQRGIATHDCGGGVVRYWLQEWGKCWVLPQQAPLDVQINAAIGQPDGLLMAEAVWAILHKGTRLVETSLRAVVVAST